MQYTEGVLRPIKLDMNLEKEKVQFKEFQLSPTATGGVLAVMESQRHFNISSLQYSYLEILRTGQSVDELVQFYLQQGWLVSFRELHGLLKFMTLEGLILNNSYRFYFCQNSGTDGVQNADSNNTRAISVAVDKLPFFRSLQPELAQHLLQHAERLEVPAHTLLVKTGNRDRDLFVLLRGQASIYESGDHKHRQLKALLHPGSLFGERGFLLNQARRADILTTTPCEVLKIPHQPDFDQLINTQKAQTLQHRFWVLHAMAASSFFRDLPGESLDHLIFSGRLCQAKAHQFLFQEGERGNTCFVLVQGSVVVSQKSQNIAVLGQGACFGEVSLMMSGGIRTAGVKTQQDSIFLEVQQRDFYRVLAQNLRLAKDIEVLAAQRLQNDTQRRSTKKAA